MTPYPHSIFLMHHIHFSIYYKKHLSMISIPANKHDQLNLNDTIQLLYIAVDMSGPAISNREPGATSAYAEN